MKSRTTLLRASVLKPQVGHAAARACGAVAQWDKVEGRRRRQAHSLSTPHVAPPSVRCLLRHGSGGGRRSSPETGTPSPSTARPAWCATPGCFKMERNSIPLGTETSPLSLCWARRQETSPLSLCWARRRWSEAGKKGLPRWAWVREPNWLSPQTMHTVPLGTQVSSHQMPLSSLTRSF